MTMARWGSLRGYASDLGGALHSDGSISCPGPGHKPHDRSLVVWFEGDDFRVHSHAGDDWQLCKDHVRAVLGLPAFDNLASAKLRPPTNAKKSGRGERIRQPTRRLPLVCGRLAMAARHAGRGVSQCARYRAAGDCVWAGDPVSRALPVQR